MQLLLVNPNTTDSMTKKMVTAANAVAATGSHIVGRTATYGPVSIEGYYDEVFSVPPLLEAISAHADADGVIVGCFDDTGVDAARCITDRPVIGICQAAMQHAAVVATRFSVVTTLSRSVPALEHLALKYGYERLCRRVRASEVPVLALEDGDPTALNKIKAEIALALRDDEAEAIVLGCGGMADLANQLSGEFEVPVVEGVTAATTIIEGLVRTGLRTSKRGGYAMPSAKTYAGRFADFAPSGATTDNDS